MFSATINHQPLEDAMRKFASFTIGAVIGGLVGATLSLLFAPESGTELRAQIRERAEAFTAEVRQAVNSKRIELQDRLETLRAPKVQ
jgi:gas vesicle protein